MSAADRLYNCRGITTQAKWLSIYVSGQTKHQAIAFKRSIISFLELWRYYTARRGYPTVKLSLALLFTVTQPQQEALNTMTILVYRSN